ncbi:hypothetical protein [Bacillus mycoides]
MSELKKYINIEDTDNATKLMENKVVKTIIHDFYIKENADSTYGIDKLLAEKNDYTVRFIMLQLLKELKYKEKYEGLNIVEQIVLLVLSNDFSKQHMYSEELVAEFKNVLKEME